MAENDPSGNGDRDFLDDRRQAHEQMRYRPGQLDRLTTSESPRVVKQALRSIATTHITDFFQNETLAPNRYAVQGILGRLDERVDDLALGAFGEQQLLDFGYSKGELQVMSPDLDPQKRSETVGALQDAKRELIEMDRFNHIVHQLIQNVGSLEAEIGLWGSWREEGLSVSMLKTIGEMGPLVDGELRFGDKVTVAMRAFLEVGNRKAQAFGVPPIFSMEPTLGGKHLAFAYAFRSVEFTRPKDSQPGVQQGMAKMYEHARPYYKNPVTYLLEEPFPQAVEDLNQNAVLADLTPAEREELTKRIAEGHELPTLPDVFNNLDTIYADPRLSDSFKAVIIGYYLFRFLRLDVDYSIQPRPDPEKAVKEGSILHTQYGFPPGTELWHVENGPQAGDLVNMMYWIPRQVEERFGRGEDSASRWSGPNSLFLGVPNMCRPLPDSMFWQRESKPGQKPKSRQNLSFRKLLLEETMITDPVTNEERRLYLRDLDWDGLYVDQAVFKEYLGDEGIEWRPGIPPRDDFALQNYLNRTYQLTWVYKTFIDYRETGDNFNAVISAQWHNKGKKKEELSFGTLNPVANEIYNPRVQQGLLDLQRANEYGSALAEHHPYYGATPQWGEGATMLAERVFNAPEGSKLFSFRETGTESLSSTSAFDARVFEVVYKMVVAKKLPTADTPEGRARIQTFVAMMRAVALEKRSIYPSEAAAVGCFGDIDTQSEAIERIGASHLYAPYNFLAETVRSDMLISLRAAHENLPRALERALSEENVIVAQRELAKMKPDQDEKAGSQSTPPSRSTGLFSRKK